MQKKALRPEIRRREAEAVPIDRYRQIESKYSNSICSECDGLIGYGEHIYWTRGFGYHYGCFQMRVDRERGL